MIDPALSALLVEQSPDGIIFAGPDGNVAFWNAGAEKIFGFSEAEAMGKSLDIIIPEKLRKAHWDGFNKAIATGTTKLHGQALPTRAENAAGETRYVELSFSLVFDADGKVLGAMAACRDIDERYRQDRTNRQRLRELEAAEKERQAAG